MSALIRESHANNLTPLWLPANTAIQGEVTELLAPSSFNVGLTGSIAQINPTFFAVYPTKAGTYYDITFLFRIDLDSGASPGYDVLELGISVDGAALGSTVGSWVTSQQIGYGSNQRNSQSIRLYCATDSTLRLFVRAVLLGGSTANYSIAGGSITVSEASPA